MSGNSFVTPEAAHKRFMDLYKENLVRARLETLLTEYPLRIFLMASTNLTPAAAFGGAHG